MVLLVSVSGVMLTAGSDWFACDCVWGLQGLCIEKRLYACIMVVFCCERVYCNML